MRHATRPGYVSLAYTQRLQEVELLASTDSAVDSYDNAMAETVQSGGDTPTEPENPAGSGAGDVCVGGLVQQPPVARATRSPPTG